MPGRARKESVSKAQQRLMGAAEHGASFPMARKVQASMSQSQMREFALGSMAGKPEHVRPPRPRISTKPKMPRAKSPDGESYAYNWRTRANLKRGR